MCTAYRCSCQTNGHSVNPNGLNTVMGVSHIVMICCHKPLILISLIIITQDFDVSRFSFYNKYTGVDWNINSWKELKIFSNKKKTEAIHSNNQNGSTTRIFNYGQ